MKNGYKQNIKDFLLLACLFVIFFFGYQTTIYAKPEDIDPSIFK